MSSDLSISPTRRLPRGLDSLVESSLKEGFRFLQRLGDEWESGSNRFTGPGEALFAARCGRLVGVCGLNRDPYCADPTIGRLRHLYVVPSYRRRGIGRELVHRALGHARGRFRIVRLRTDSRAGGLFYAAVGFSPVPGAREATHHLHLLGGDAAGGRGRGGSCGGASAG